ncbi:hypothetical protein CVU37_02070 [candidate division BRC1 bacterium HGW-BRC1-1]|nr:MAG: hypothetical protein CVU37_02070 [candidate division BRC1 bacterium HGW-BRC1-1]
MKKSNVLTLALCLGAASLAFAAEGQSTLGEQTTQTTVISSRGAGRGGRQASGLGAARLAALKKLTLTDEQKTKLDEIEKSWQEGFKTVQTDMIKMRQESGTTGTLDSRAKMRETLMALDKDVNTKIDAMLTPDQKKELEQQMTESEKMTPRRMRDRNTSAPAAKPE